MEPIAAFALELAKFLHTNFEPSFIAIALIALALTRSRSALVLTLIALLLTLPLTKAAIAQPRPCTPGEVIYGITCPTTHGFPSTHAALTLPLAYFTLHRLGGLFFIALTAFVTWSRLVLGMHTLLQVAAGAALGLAIAIIIESFIKGD